MPKTRLNLVSAYHEQNLTALAQWAAGRLDKGWPPDGATHATPRDDVL